MYLKSDQKNIKNTDLWSSALLIHNYPCTEFDWFAAESVSAPEWTIKGWIQRFVLFDWLPLNGRCSENSVAQRGEVVY